MRIMKTEVEAKTLEPHWAALEADKVLARRAAREAEVQAETAAEEYRQRVPADLLRQRFRATAALVLEALDHFRRAVPIELDHAHELSIRVTANAGTDVLLLRLDDWMIVERRGPSTAEESPIDLSAETFSPETAARRIAEQWISQLAAREKGVHHVTR
jgi:hypothetical protein